MRGNVGSAYEETASKIEFPIREHVFMLRVRREP